MEEEAWEESLPGFDQEMFYCKDILKYVNYWLLKKMVKLASCFHVIDGQADRTFSCK